MTTTGPRRSSVLLVASQHRARRLLRKYPDRWDHVICFTHAHGECVLRGLSITSLTIDGPGQYTDAWGHFEDMALSRLAGQPDGGGAVDYIGRDE